MGGIGNSKNIGTAEDAENTEEIQKRENIKGKRLWLSRMLRLRLKPLQKGQMIPCFHLVSISGFSALSL